MLSRLVTALLQRSKCLLIPWLQSPSVVILEPKKIKPVTVSIVSPSICHEVMGPNAMILVFWILSFKPAFSLSSFTFIKRLFSSSSLSAIRVVSSAYLRLLILYLITIKWNQKNGQRNWIGISPRKRYKWLTGIWKIVQYHQSSEKYKSKLHWGRSHLMEWLWWNKFFFFFFKAGLENWTNGNYIWN